MIVEFTKQKPRSNHAFFSPHLLIYVGAFYEFQVGMMFYLYQFFLTCLSKSNNSSCEFFIVIAGSVFDPTQVWNKYFPVNYFWWKIQSYTYQKKREW